MAPKFLRLSNDPTALRLYNTVLVGCGFPPLSEDIVMVMTYFIRNIRVGDKQCCSYSYTVENDEENYLDSNFGIILRKCVPRTAIIVYDPETEEITLRQFLLTAPKVTPFKKVEMYHTL